MAMVLEGWPSDCPRESPWQSELAGAGAGTSTSTEVKRLLCRVMHLGESANAPQLHVVPWLKLVKASTSSVERGSLCPPVP